MSMANKKYLLSHNNYLNPDKVEINPNSINPQVFLQDDDEKKKIKQKYLLPLNAKLFIYGGNLGKPQGTEFLLETIRTNTNKDVFFVVVGAGTAFNSIEKWFSFNKPKNARLLAGLPKTDFDLLLNACYVGLIFLNQRFTIPNFPSRLLSYLEMKLPVIAATDDCSDIGDVLEDNNCGFKIEAGNLLEMQNAIDILCTDKKKHKIMSENAWSLLKKDFDVIDSYNLIKNRVSCINHS
jgi:glycosyltransferase involved in cell wall biosynthesis